jgi:hypothetical protein
MMFVKSPKGYAFKRADISKAQRLKCETKAFADLRSRFLSVIFENQGCFAF